MLPWGNEKGCTEVSRDSEWSGRRMYLKERAATSLSICGWFARFIRWDRSGAIVTQSFDYIKEPHILASFFWRYAHLNQSQRGYNASVSPASPEDLQQIQHVEHRFRKDNPAHCEFRIIMVLDRDVPKVETPFIISFPLKYTARSPFGRAINSAWRSTVSSIFLFLTMLTFTLRVVFITVTVQYINMCIGWQQLGDTWDIITKDTLLVRQRPHLLDTWPGSPCLIAVSVQSINNFQSAINWTSNIRKY